MIRFVVHDEVGRVLAWGEATQPELQAQVPGSSVIVGVDDAVWSVLDAGGLCHVEGGVLIPAPPRPGRHWRFDHAGGIWVQDTAAAWAALRAARDARLAASDWTQVADAPVDGAAWAAYRRALRDLPAVTDDPADPDWPSPPA